MKLDSSPTPIVEVKNRCSRFLISSTKTPAIGPKVNAHISAGKSEKSIFINDGTIGRLKSSMNKTNETALHNATDTMLLTLKLPLFFDNTSPFDNLISPFYDI